MKNLRFHILPAVFLSFVSVGNIFSQVQYKSTRGNKDSGVIVTPGGDDSIKLDENTKNNYYNILLDPPHSHSRGLNISVILHPKNSHDFLFHALNRITFDGTQQDFEALTKLICSKDVDINLRIKALRNLALFNTKPLNASAFEFLKYLVIQKDIQTQDTTYVSDDGISEMYPIPLNVLAKINDPRVYGFFKERFIASSSSYEHTLIVNIFKDGHDEYLTHLRNDLAAIKVKDPSFPNY